MPTVKSYQKQKEKEQIAYNYFLSQGYSPEATAGIVGNLVYESGLNTTARGDIGYTGGDSYGIAQFRGKRLQDLKKRYGNNWTDFGNQLDFVRHELETTHKKAGNILKNTRDVYQAGQTFSDLYEIPAKKYKNNSDRQKKVNKIYSSLSGAQVSNTPISDQAISNVNTYFENQPTTDVKDLVITEENVNFDAEPDVEVAEEKVKDKDIEEVQKQTAEYNFLEEYKALVNQQQSPPEPVQMAQPIQQAPQQNLTDIYNQVSEFIDAPMAQEGGQYYDLPMNNATILTPEEFTQYYLNSAKYKERLTASGYINPNEVIKNRLNKATTVENVIQEGKPSILEGIWNEVTNTPYSNQGSAYDPETNTIIMDSITDKSKKSTKGAHKKAIKTHELGHAEIAGYPLNRKDENELFDRQKSYKLEEDFNFKDREALKNKSRQVDFRDIGHDWRPEENKSDLNALRYILKQEGIYDAGKENFTKEHLKKLKSNFFKDRLLKNYKEEDLIWLMNNVAANETSEQTDRYAQQGTTIGNLTPQQTADVESQRQWINNWNRNRVIGGTKINTNSDIPFSSDIYIDDLNYGINPREKTFGEFDVVSDRLLLDNNYQSKPGIPVHELTHRYQKYLEPSSYGKYINEPISTALQNTQGSSEYHGNVDENQAELNRLRYNAGFKPDQVITPQDLQRYNADDYNLKHFSQEQLTDLLNTTAYNENTNNRVYAQEGRVIKDQEGQRRHRGKVTEIQGNTMSTEGYGNMSLYVVPDVGMPQIIEANTGEYTFPNATKFTEYPLTENEKEFLKHIAKTK